MSLREFNRKKQARTRFPSLLQYQQPLQSMAGERELLLKTELDKQALRRGERFYSYFAVGNPAAFQALKPPAIDRTFL